MPKISNTQEFIKKANILHNNKFDYSNVEYKNNSTKVNIICPFGHLFYQTPNSHLNGRTCPTCHNKNITTEKFIVKAKIIHNNKYDYSLVIYTKSYNHVKIICPKHGIFIQKPNSHLQKKGCFSCGQDIVISRTKTVDEFIKEANIIHCFKYNYDSVNYINCKTYIDILCIQHGIYKQKPSIHLTGRGCPTCNNSKGEIKILELLKKLNINYISQFSVKKSDKYTDKWNYIKNCRFDFYLPKYNIIIEYHGIQHYIFSQFFHGTIEEMNKRRKRDNDKKEFCKENNIKYFEIAYNTNILDEFNNILQHIQTAGNP